MNERESAMPDTFDRLLGSLDGLPDATKTKPTTIQTTTLLGVSELYIVQTIRQASEGDTIFLQCASKGGMIRLALPSSVAEAIARQRDSLTSKVRSKTSSRLAQERKDRGERPGFLKNREKK
jgi:hypothetical protein